MAAIDETTQMRELDCRSRDGICVRLLWEPGTDGVYVAVDDERTGDRFQMGVQPDEALEAFRHPYAYDRRRGRWECVGFTWD